MSCIQKYSTETNKKKGRTSYLTSFLLSSIFSPVLYILYTPQLQMSGLSTIKESPFARYRICLALYTTQNTHSNLCQCLPSTSRVHKRMEISYGNSGYDCLFIHSFIAYITVLQKSSNCFHFNNPLQGTSVLLMHSCYRYLLHEYCSSWSV